MAAPLTFALPPGAAEPRDPERWTYDRDTGRVETDDGRPVVYVASNRMDAADVSGGKGRATRTGLMTAAAPEMLDLLRQYRNDMAFPDLDFDQRERRIEAIDAVIRKAGERP